MKRAILTVAAVLLGASVQAGDVKVEGVHLCCGMCVKAVNETMAKAEGVTDVAVDKDAGTVTFKTADAKAARQGVITLARAGFGGKASHDGKEVKLPKGFKEDGQADSVTVRGLHNCCPGCVKGITAALEKVEGVTAVNCEKKNCTLTGKGIKYSAVIAALHDAGLHGNIPGPDAAEEKGAAAPKKTE
jgi:copper chaperone CopZ